MFYVRLVPAYRVPESVRLGQPLKDKPVNGGLPGPLRTHHVVRYEVYRQSILVRRFPRADVGDGRALCEQLLLLDRRAQSLEWSKAPVRIAIYVRAFQVLGEFPECLEAYWMEVPNDLFRTMMHDFSHEIQAVGARYRGGEAADLIFLAQLTPVS